MKRTLISLCATSFIALTLIATYHNDSTTNLLTTFSPAGKTKLKTILFWNDKVEDKEFYFGLGRQPLIDAGCRVSECVTTRDRTLLETNEVDAILWGLRPKDDRSIPKIRNPRIYYIMYMMEPPYHAPDIYDRNAFSVYQSAFNLTLSYRRDSDFYRPYGITMKTDETLEVANISSIMRAKTKKVAWFVSNCHSSNERDVLAKSLSRYIKIDIYGKCGPLDCPRTEEEECYHNLDKNYKFYLSFENSLCLDYVTEKLYNIYLFNVIPVVYGIGYENLNLPPHSYIDVLDFKSVKELGDYLNYLDKNDTAYVEYLEWKKYYRLPDRKETWQQNFCSICEFLHGDNITKRKTLELKKPTTLSEKKSGIRLPSHHIKDALVSGYTKIYNDMWNWFMEDVCIYPKNNLDIHRFVRDLDANGKPNYE